MKLIRPKHALAGFQADSPSEQAPELLYIGEQWLPNHFVIARHAHDAWEFHLQLDGISRWESEGRDFTLQAGSFFIAPPHVAHAMKGQAEVKHHFFFAGLELEPIIRRYDALRSVWHQQDCICLADGYSLQAPFRQLIREVSMRLPYRNEGIRSALDCLVIEASRLFDNTARPIAPHHPAVEQARDLLERHCERSWPLAKLGKQVGLSPNHLVELFTREVGLSPHKYQLRQRVERAKELLCQSDISITHIAFDLGFSSSQHFARMFRQNVGQGAFDFRKYFQNRLPLPSW